LRILVTDSDNRSALAAVRALGRRGHEVFVAGERHPSLASVSRYCAAFDAYPSAINDPQGFLAAVIDIVTARRIDVLMPMTEISTLLLTEHQERLPAHVKLPFPSAAAVAAAADKSRVLAIAEQLGVPIPKTIVCDSADAARSRVEHIGFPVVIKATRSRVWSGTRWLSTSVRYAPDQASFDAHLAEISPLIYPVLLQERIDGPGVGVFLCCDAAGVVASFAHRRIREKPPSGGVSVLCESALPDPVALAQATRLLQHLEWRGVAMVEFKRNLRDGSLRLMEINGRFWGSLQLAIDAGVDFPSLLLDIAQERRPESPPQYQVGVRTRWLLGDVDSLLSVLLRSRSRLHLPSSHPGKWRTLMDFLTCFNKQTRFELERADDPRPARLELKRWLFGHG
jgi:predicted ATP-grasp superfamily ATP-dependent carboligase